MRYQCATILALCSWISVTQGASIDALGELLRWHEEPKALCRGYFAQNEAINQAKAVAPISESQTTITAEQRTRFSQHSTSTLEGNVRIRQTGRELSADQVELIRNPKTQAISHIELKGHVRFEEQGRLLAGHRAHANLTQNTVCAHHGAFRAAHPTPIETLNAWGRVEDALRDRDGIITLKNVTYSVCPIQNPMWQIRANQIVLNRHTGVGTAKHAKFYLWGVPVFYWPHMSYPIKRERKSGVLLPLFGYEEHDGLSIEIPYYFNLAPNYDALLSVNYKSLRGYKFDGTYRYLTKRSNGKLYASILPRDKEFRSFQHGAQKKYHNRPEFIPYLSRIDNAGDDRFSFSAEDNTVFSPHWSSTVQLNYVSDDYYLRDFGSNPVNSNQNQLLNQAKLLYQSDHWQFSGEFSNYETLHPIGSINPEPYSRLPQLIAMANYPCSQFGLDYDLIADYTNFDHQHNFITNTPVVSTHRLHIHPGVGYSWRAPWGYLNPHVGFDSTRYWLRDRQDGDKEDIQRILPVVNIDSGLLFERASTHFRQTLEPRAYYLWVPKENQDSIPIFDTTLPRFSFEQLFFTNRFTGFDRYGDANQITFALSSHWYENLTGVERFNASIGIIYQFQKRAVCLYPDCLDDPTRNEKISPLLMNITYKLSPTSYTQADIAWSPTDARCETGNLRLHYEPTHNQILHLGYDFVREGDHTEDANNHNLSRIDLGVAWPLGHQWQALANWNYNISHRHIQHYFLGASYDSCCWAVRGIVSRTALDVSYKDNEKFDTKYYVELKFKGLGTLGNARPSDLLNTSITGYHDLFR